MSTQDFCFISQLYLTVTAKKWIDMPTFSTVVFKPLQNSWILFLMHKPLLIFCFGWGFFAYPLCLKRESFA